MQLDQIKPISFEVNEKGNVSIGGCDLVDIAKEFGTPVYVMCEDTMRERARAYENAFKKHYPDHLTVFASKSFNCQASCKLMDQEGLGLDVVSDGEMYTALSVGFPAEKIILHGNNKPPQELEMAIRNEIGSIMLDNFFELSLIENIAKELIKDPELKANKESRALKLNLMVRVTPGIECHTHEYIQTGHLDSKFGFVLEELDDAISKLLDLQKEFASLNIELNIRGLHAHIGSQIFETVPHQDTAKVLLELYKKLKDKFGIEFPDLNVGGGLGIMYEESDDPPSIEKWVQLIADAVKKYCAEFGVKEPRLMVEPGRSMVGPAGVTLYKVGTIKEIPGIRKYVSVDGGMADNSRPIMYQAKYDSELVSKPHANGARQDEMEKVTIAGRYCESGDILIQETHLPKIASNDLLVIYSTGAYNYSMASNYNRTTRLPVVLVKDGKAELIVKRESYEDIVKLDLIPASWS